MDLKKLGIRNLEIFSNTDSRGNIKVNYDDLLKKGSVYNEMLEGLINAIKTFEDSDHFFTGQYIEIVEKATGRTWDEIKEIICGK